MTHVQKEVSCVVKTRRKFRIWVERSFKAGYDDSGGKDDGGRITFPGLDPQGARLQHVL